MPSYPTPINAFARFCYAIRKPVNVFVFLYIALFALSSSDGTVHRMMHQCRIALIFVLTFCIIVQFMNIRTRKNLEKEPLHAR